MDRVGRLSLETIRMAEDKDGNKIEQKYVFLVPIGAPYQECYDVAVEMAKEIILMSEEANKAFKADNPDSSDEIMSDKAIEKETLQQDSGQSEEVE